MNPELRFPKPPFRIDTSVVGPLPPDNAVSSYLDQIRSWRSAVLTFIDKPGEKLAPDAEGLTERAQKALATFLASNWSPGMTDYAAQSPYNISAFPASALETVANPTTEPVLDVLRWRAGLVDYLSDVWDVIGEPFLELEECGAIGSFLDPVEKEQLCYLCLSEFRPEQRDPGRHDCLLTRHVRAKWPAMPPVFAKWAEEARTPATEP